ncbi:hypothetical protein HDV01_004315 [Terramyces sp. JEL0728]|nr:hypothetical protein HDV01_004315 [Terramyces sp. JEL0728]
MYGRYPGHPEIANGNVYGNQYGYVIAKQNVQPYPTQQFRPQKYAIRPDGNAGYPQLAQPAYAFPPNTFPHQYPPNIAKNGMPNGRFVIPPIRQASPYSMPMYAQNVYAPPQRAPNLPLLNQEFYNFPANQSYHQRSASPAPSEISQHSRTWTISSRPSTPVIIRPTLTTNERYRLHRSNSQVSVEYEPYTQAEYRKLKSRDMHMKLPRGLGHFEGEQWHYEVNTE